MGNVEMKGEELAAETQQGTMTAEQEEQLFNEIVASMLPEEGQELEDYLEGHESETQGE